MTYKKDRKSSNPNHQKTRKSITVTKPVTTLLRLKYFNMTLKKYIFFHINPTQSNNI